MAEFAEAHGRKSTIRLIEAPALGHDEAALATPAQRLFSVQMQ
jgi:hypothetical protein